MRYLDRVLNAAGLVLAGLAVFLNFPTWVGVVGFSLIAFTLFLPDRFRR
ncbi:hypothetical protein [Brevundimonas sp.]|nr:hypothetical protein [Brevundimonas sp.]